MTKSLPYQALLYVYNPDKLGLDGRVIQGPENRLYTTIYEDSDLTSLVVRMESNRARWHTLGYFTRSVYGNNI
jgi:hypothetical protein